VLVAEAVGRTLAALGPRDVFGLIGSGNFHNSLLSYNLPHVTRIIIDVSMIGVATSAMTSIFLLPPRPAYIGRISYLWYILEWLLIPITLIVFGALPGLEAQTRLMLGGKYRLGFWVTPKSRAKANTV